MLKKSIKSVGLGIVVVLGVIAASLFEEIMIVLTSFLVGIAMTILTFIATISACILSEFYIILITALLVIAAYAAYPYLRELIYVKPKRRR